MPIMTKKEIKRLKQSEWHGEGAYIIKNLIETVEKMAGVLECYRYCDIADECLSKYEGKD